MGVILQGVDDAGYVAVVNVVCWVTTFGFWRQTEELEQIWAKEEEVVVYRR